VVTTRFSTMPINSQLLPSSTPPFLAKVIAVPDIPQLLTPAGDARNQLFIQEPSWFVPRELSPPDRVELQIFSRQSSRFQSSDFSFLAPERQARTPGHALGQGVGHGFRLLGQRLRSRRQHRPGSRQVKRPLPPGDHHGRYRVADQVRDFELENRKQGLTPRSPSIGVDS